MPMSLNFKLSLPSEHLSSAEKELSEASDHLKTVPVNDEVKTDFARQINKAQEKIEVKKGKIWSFGKEQLAKEAKHLRETISAMHIDSFPNSTSSSCIATEAGDAGGKSNTKDCSPRPDQSPQSSSCPSPNRQANTPNVCISEISSPLHPSGLLELETRSAIHSLQQSGKTDVAFNRRHSMVQLSPTTFRDPAVLTRSTSARLATPRFESFSPPDANPWDGRSNHYDTNSPGDSFVGGFAVPLHVYIRASGSHHPHPAVFPGATHYLPQTPRSPSLPHTPSLVPNDHFTFPQTPISPLPGPSYMLDPPPEPSLRDLPSAAGSNDNAEATSEEYLQATDEKHPPPPYSHG